MSDDMKNYVRESLDDAFDICNTEKEIATFMKNRMVEKYKGTWNCVVGRNFGSFVTYETRNYIYLYVGQTAILLFKTG